MSVFSCKCCFDWNIREVNKNSSFVLCIGFWSSIYIAISNMPTCWVFLCIMVFSFKNCILLSKDTFCNLEFLKFYRIVSYHFKIVDQLVACNEIASNIFLIIISLYIIRIFLKNLNPIDNNRQYIISMPCIVNAVMYRKPRWIRRRVSKMYIYLYIGENSILLIIHVLMHNFKCKFFSRK